MKIQSEKVFKKKKRINNIYNDVATNNLSILEEFRISNRTVEQKIAKAQDFYLQARSNGNIYSLEDWCHYYGLVSTRTIQRWADEIPEIAELLEMGKEAIGLRREKQAIGADPNRKLDAPYVMKYLHQWLPRYHRHEVFMAELSKKSEDKPQNITVVLDKYPESPIVKDKDNA